MAEVIALREVTGGPASSYAAAVDRYLAVAGITPASGRIYRIALATWAWLLVGGQPPTGRARRGATSPAVPFAALDDPATPARLAEAFAERAAAADADTCNRELSMLRAAVSWWQRQGWLHADPTVQLQRRPAPPDRTRALTHDQLQALFAREVSLREKTY